MHIFGGRGTCYVEIGEWKKGIADLNSAICLGSKVGYFISDFKMRGLAYEKLGNKERAEEDYQTARLMEQPLNYYKQSYFDSAKKTLTFRKRG